MDIQSTIVQIVAAIAMAVITRYIVPWIKARTTAEQQTALNEALDTLVAAAEQMYGNNRGSDKLRAVEGWIETRGLDASSEDIESAVFRMKQNSPLQLIDDDITEQ
ncbi:hypothetical protein FACS1894184_13690 [Clostridia bacterium]|nr:hypothetical protein FACS1894184_13690 [Clostridia bacterium]